MYYWMDKGIISAFNRNKTTSVFPGYNRCTHCVWSTKTSCTCCQDNETWGKCYPVNAKFAELYVKGIEMKMYHYGIILRYQFEVSDSSELKA